MNSRYLSIIVGVTLAIVFTISGALSISVAVKNARAVVKYDKITVDEETVHYLAAYYKVMYFEELANDGVEATDTQEFWSSESKYGMSYGEHYEASLRSFIAKLVAAANHYANHSTYTPDDKIALTTLCDHVLTSEADGDVSIFNAKAKKYGFHYNDFQNAAALIYKAKRAEECYIKDSSIDIELLMREVDFKSGYSDINTIAIPALESFIIYR